MQGLIEGLNCIYKYNILLSLLIKKVFLLNNHLKAVEGRWKSSSATYICKALANDGGRHQVEMIMTL